MKKALCFALVLFILSSSCFAFADTNVQVEPSEAIGSSSQFIDLDTAVTAALMFAYEMYNTLPNCEWTLDTYVADVITMYDSRDTISAYCVELETDNQSAGYIVVSAYDNMTLIPEFSCEGNSPVDLMNLNSNQRAYYTGAIAFSNSKGNPDTDTFVISNEKQAENLSYVTAAKDHADTAIAITTRGNPYENSGYKISSVSDYMDDEFGSGNYVMTDSCTCLVNSVPSYDIALWNGCVVYATAAMFKCFGYQLRLPNKTLQQYVDELAEYARDEGYAVLQNGSYNYSINLVNEFISGALSDLYGKTASVGMDFLSSMWTTAKTQLHTYSNPCALSVTYANGGHYVSHTMAVASVYEFELTSTGLGTKIRFFGVRDGYDSAIRYVRADSILAGGVTSIQGL